MSSFPKIALLHGWATDPLILQVVQTQLKNQNVEVCVYEMPGYGSRRTEPSARTIEELADDAMEKLEGARIWVGWSLGAMVALAAAAKRPSALKGVVGVCATATFCCDATKEESLEALRQSVTANPEKAIKRFQRSLPAPANRRAVAKHAELSPFASDDKLLATVESLLSGLDILARADLCEEVNKIDVPVKLISGLEDAIIPASSGEALQKLISDCRYTALPCGHLPFLECPELFMEQLFEFAQTIAESAASQKPV